MSDREFAVVNSDEAKMDPYAEVIKQLESVKDQLTQSQLKKLAYARKHKPNSFIQKKFSPKIGIYSNKASGADGV